MLPRRGTGHLAAQRAGGRLRPRPVLPSTSGGPDDHGRPGSPAPGHTAPAVLLGQQISGVGLDEQLFEHRVHHGLLVVPGLRNDQLPPACPARGVAATHRADTTAVRSRTPHDLGAAWYCCLLDGYGLGQSVHLAGALASTAALGVAPRRVRPGPVMAAPGTPDCDYAAGLVTRGGRPWPWAGQRCRPRRVRRRPGLTRDVAARRRRAALVAGTVS